MKYAVIFALLSVMLLNWTPPSIAPSFAGEEIELRQGESSSVAISGNPKGIAFDRSNRRILVAGSGNDTLNTLGVDGAVINVMTVGDEPVSVQISDRFRSVLVVNAGSRSVSVIDQDDLTLRTVVDLNPYVDWIDPIRESLLISDPAGYAYIHGVKYRYNPSGTKSFEFGVIIAINLMSNTIEFSKPVRGGELVSRNTYPHGGAISSDGRYMLYIVRSQRAASIVGVTYTDGDEISGWRNYVSIGCLSINTSGDIVRTFTGDAVVTYSLDTIFNSELTWEPKSEEFIGPNRVSRGYDTLCTIVSEGRSERIYILDRDHNRVVVYDGTLKAITSIFEVQDRPADIAYDEDTRTLFVSHPFLNLVSCYRLGL